MKFHLAKSWADQLPDREQFIKFALSMLCTGTDQFRIGLCRTDDCSPASHNSALSFRRNPRGPGQTPEYYSVLRCALRSFYIAVISPVSACQ